MYQRATKFPPAEACHNSSLHNSIVINKIIAYLRPLLSNSRTTCMFSLPVAFNLCPVQKTLATEVSPLPKLMAARLSSKIGTPDMASRETATKEFTLSILGASKWVIPTF